MLKVVLQLLATLQLLPLGQHWVALAAVVWARLRLRHSKNIGSTESTAMRMKIGSMSFWMMANCPRKYPSRTSSVLHTTAPITLNNVNTP